jgi:hypothetical protein
MGKRKTINTSPDIKGGEWKKQKNDLRRQRVKEDKLPMVREGKSNTPWTLERAVALCIMAYRCKYGAVPYSEDSEEQISWWEKQYRDGIQPAKRKILMKTIGFPPETKKHSPTINDMQSHGKTVEMAKKRKREGYEAVSRKHMGHDQKQSVEGVAIHLLLVFFRAVICGFDRDWEVMPVFDGLEADFMMRKKDWQPDVWVPIQMKSVSECVIGKGVTYNLKYGDYKNVFCVCVGLLGFEHRVADVTGPNDIANALGCSIGEIFNIGSCSDIEKSLHPTFGVPYSKLPASRRLHFPGADDEAKHTFAESLLRDIENWRPRLSRGSIFYEFSDIINSKVTVNYKTEKSGFKVVDAALRTCGLRVDPVWRQNECVDYAVASIESGEPLVFVSGKTGTVNNNEPKHRSFLLNGAPNKSFCNVVVASYSGARHKVAVMSRDTAYVKGAKSFCWSDGRSKPGVCVFDDIRTSEDARKFSDYILSFRATRRGG